MRFRLCVVVGAVAGSFYLAVVLGGTLATWYIRFDRDGDFAPFFVFGIGRCGAWSGG